MTFSASKRAGERKEREEKEKETKRAAERLHPHAHSYPEEAGALHPLGYPCQTPAAPLGTEYVALHCTICKDCEASKWGPRNVLVQHLVIWFSICHTILCRTGDEHPENRRVSASPAFGLKS